MQTFWSKVERLDADKCWTWRGAKNDRGYGFISIGGHIHRVHRLSYEMHIGPVPEGQHVLHKCDNRACVNPAHLWCGTHKQNMRDMARKGRAVASQRKLSWGDVCAIRASSESQKILADRYDIDTRYVADLRRFKYRQSA